MRSPEYHIGSFCSTQEINIQNFILGRYILRCTAANSGFKMLFTTVDPTIYLPTLYIFVCLFDLTLYVPSTIFQLNRDRSSWVEPVLSYDICVLLKAHNAVMPVRLEPAASQSRVKHSTTEPLHSLKLYI